MEPKRWLVLITHTCADAQQRAILIGEEVRIGVRVRVQTHRVQTTGIIDLEGRGRTSSRLNEHDRHEDQFRIASFRRVLDKWGYVHSTTSE